MDVADTITDSKQNPGHHHFMREALKLVLVCVLNHEPADSWSRLKKPCNVMRPQ